MQLWLDFLQIQAKTSLKQRLDFPDKKRMQLWSDLLKFEAYKSLKQRLLFLLKNGFQLSSDFLQIQVKKSLHCNYGEISFKFKPQNL